MLKREIITTADGSSSLHIPEWNEQYHSKHGAIQESNHVFVESGLNYFITHQTQDELNIIEAGFGTGLNALITAIWANDHQQKVNYLSLEAYPVLAEEISKLNFTEQLGKNRANLFTDIHTSEWEKEINITPFFKLTKQQKYFQDLELNKWGHLVFYDAFGPRVQPHLWETEVLSKFYHALKKGGIFTTYCAKGQVRRDLQSLGFNMERIPGPPGKREMLRGIKK